ncbi:hypothetical protein AB0M58_13560 [Streptomyces bobili]|uniref:hypothetical protein n=1 Tax=Streptomyces bobili TaxID=67280 RepID=UPI00344A51B7
MPPPYARRLAGRRARMATTAGWLREAAALIRRRAAEAASSDERWMVDQDETGALVLAVFTPENVEPDGAR